MSSATPAARSGAPDATAPARRLRRRAHETVPARAGELLQVAATMFQQRGYDATSVSDIGQALGITKGSVYHYIDSKEDLLYRICKSVHDDASRVIERVEAMEGTAIERLEAYIRETVASNARNVTKIAVYYRDLSRLTGQRRADIDRDQRRYETLLVDLIEEGKASGEIDTGVSTRVMSANLLAQIIWLYTWFREEKGLEPDTFGADVAGLALYGIAARRPRRRRA